MDNKKEIKLEDAEKISGGFIKLPDGFKPFISVVTEPSDDPKNVNQNNNNKNSNQQNNVEGDNDQNDVVIQNK